MKLSQILATFVLADDVADPKIRGVRSGYSPHHKFAGVDYLVSGVHLYGDNDIHYPGEVLVVEISFPSWIYFSDKVKLGDSFEVLELDRIVGWGKVEAIF